MGFFSAGSCRLAQFELPGVYSTRRLVIHNRGRKVRQKVDFAVRTLDWISQLIAAQSMSDELD